MSAENFFVLRVGFFCLCFAVCRMFCMVFRLCLLVFCGAFQHSLWCASMLPSVKFEHVAGL